MLSNTYNSKQILNFSAWFIFIIFLVYYLTQILKNKDIAWDDAYMYIRYANNILSGDGYTWNAGEGPTFGCTSITYTFFIAGAKFLFPFLSPTAILILSSISFSLGSLLALFLLFRSTFPFAANVFCVIAIVILGVGDLFLCHAITGMDTFCSFFFNTITLLFIWKAIPSSKIVPWLLAAFSSYLAYLTRIDSIILICLFPLILFIYYRPSNIKMAFYFYVFLIFFISLDFAFKFYYFGDPFPLPFYAKKQDYFIGYIAAAVWNPFYYLKEIILYLSPFLVITIYILKNKSLKLLPLFIPVLLSTVFTLGFVQIMGGCSRFYFHMIPQSLFVLMLLAKHSLKEKGVEFKWVNALFALAIPFFILFFLNKLAGKWEIITEQSERKEALPIPTNPQLKPMNWYQAIQAIDKLCKKLPRNTSITASEHGIISANNPAIKIIDLVGLHDPILAKQGYLEEYLMSKKPAIIWMPHTDYTGLYNKIISGKRFNEKYFFIPSAFLYGVAVSKEDTKVQQILKQELREHYPNISLDF